VTSEGELMPWWWGWWRTTRHCVGPLDLRLVRDLRVLRGELDAMRHDLRSFDHEVRAARGDKR
jgi:hypothetical protein